jgi:hypothetical protein
MSEGEIAVSRSTANLNVADGMKSWHNALCNGVIVELYLLRTFR